MKKLLVTLLVASISFIALARIVSKTISGQGVYVELRTESDGFGGERVMAKSNSNVSYIFFSLDVDLKQKQGNWSGGNSISASVKPDGQWYRVASCTSEYEILSITGEITGVNR